MMAEKLDLNCLIKKVQCDAVKFNRLLEQSKINILFVILVIFHLVYFEKLRVKGEQKILVNFGLAK